MRRIEEAGVQSSNPGVNSSRKATQLALCAIAYSTFDAQYTGRIPEQTLVARVNFTRRGSPHSSIVVMTFGGTIQ
jgi:hypothetical protein